MLAKLDIIIRVKNKIKKNVQLEYVSSIPNLDLIFQNSIFKIQLFKKKLNQFFKIQFFKMLTKFEFKLWHLSFQAKYN